MFKGVDHVVIAVKDLDGAVGRYETIYGTGVSDRSEAPAAGMAMAFFRFGDSCSELVSSTGDQGPIAKRLAEQGEGVHLVAMKVDNIESKRRWPSCATRASGWWANRVRATRSRDRCSSTLR